MTVKQDQHQKGSWQSWMFSRMTMFFGLGVLAAGTYVADYLRNPQTNKAQQHHHTHNHKHDPGIEYPLIPHTTKARSPMQASVELVGDEPQKAGDEFALKVTLLSDKPVRDVKAKWILPKGVELVQGTTRDYINELGVDKEVVFSVQLKQLSSSNERIHFRATASHSGMRSSLTLQYNSIDQAEIDRKNRNLRELASEQMQKDLAVDALQKEKALKSFKPAE